MRQRPGPAPGTGFGVAVREVEAVTEMGEGWMVVETEEGGWKVVHRLPWPAG